MLYLFSALYCEVQPLIQALALKKRQPGQKRQDARQHQTDRQNLTSSPFQQFTNETQDILLTLTGPGPSAASAAVASVLSLLPPSEADLLLSFGSCAAPLPAEDVLAAEPGIYRLVKLLDFADLRSFYPDLLYTSHFPEAGCLSFARILNLQSEHAAWQTAVLETMEREHCALYDMEATAVYQSGSHFLGPHQMHFLRLVSDPGEGRAVTPEDISLAVERELPLLLPEIEELQCRIRQESEKPPLFTPTDETLFERLCRDLCCSVVMAAQLRQLLRYLSLAEQPWQTAAKALYENGTLPCRNRKQGKEVLDAFRKQFLS